MLSIKMVAHAIPMQPISIKISRCRPFLLSRRCDRRRWKGCVCACLCARGSAVRGWKNGLRGLCFCFFHLFCHVNHIFKTHFLSNVSELGGCISYHRCYRFKIYEILFCLSSLLSMLKTFSITFGISAAAASGILDLTWIFNCNLIG